jgi:hypothetical protein
VIPILALPYLYALHSRVRNWEAVHDGRTSELRLDAVWLQP